VLAPATLAALPSTRAIPNRDVFYVARLPSAPLNSLVSIALRLGLRKCSRASSRHYRFFSIYVTASQHTLFIVDVTMRKKDSDISARSRLLVLVDESNVGSSVRTAGRGLDWLKLRDFLAGPNTGRDLIEMVVYAGLPPAIPTWQEERDRKNKFVQWLRSNGFMVVTKDGAPAEEGHYKANVDVMMAIDALELSIEMRPDVVILVTGDADFAYLAIKLRRHGIRVEVASVAANLGNTLRSAANEVLDLAPLFRTFEIMKVQDAPAPMSHGTQSASGGRRRQPRFRPT
jgi:uncharacterized LabA/DUF88 family protein